MVGWFGRGLASLQHLLVTRDFLPELGGAARRNVSLARCYPEPMSVSTVASRNSSRHDTAEDYKIDRQPFPYRRSTLLLSRIRWELSLAKRCRDRVQVLHCGDVQAAAAVVWRMHKRLRIPYILYLSADDVCILRDGAPHGGSVRGTIGRRAARRLLGDAAGIVAFTEHAAALARAAMEQFRISQPPPVIATGIGADPELFAPGRGTGTLRQRWGIRRAPILLTVARLAALKGQDTGIQALALLRGEFPSLRYVLVGEGSDEARLRNLAADLSVMDRVGFAGAMRDDELPEAYATSTIYLDATRVAPGREPIGHGIAPIEALAAGLPVVASEAAAACSLLRSGDTAIIVEVADAPAIADAVASLLRDEQRRGEMGLAAREAVESNLNWNRVAHDTAKFVRECVSGG